MIVGAEDEDDEDADVMRRPWSDPAGAGAGTGDAFAAAAVESGERWTVSTEDADAKGEDCADAKDSLSKSDDAGVW